MASDLKLRWYLGLMRPHPNGDWILLRDLYTDARAFNYLLNDLSEPFRSDDTDLVAGPEAMGPPTLQSMRITRAGGGASNCSAPALSLGRGFCWWISGSRRAGRRRHRLMC